MLGIETDATVDTHVVGGRFDLLINAAGINVLPGNPVKTEIEILVPVGAAQFSRCNLRHTRTELPFHKPDYGPILYAAKLSQVDSAIFIVLTGFDKLFRGKETPYAFNFHMMQQLFRIFR